MGMKKRNFLMDTTIARKQRRQEACQNRQRAFALPTITTTHLHALMFVTSSTIPQFNLMMDATHTQDVNRSHVFLV
jgi:hypothetical protein